MLGIELIEKNPKTANDFLKYFKEKAKKTGINYQIVRIKDNSILKSCVKEYTSSDIKKVIDYIWKHDDLHIVGKIINYKQYGIYLLSSYYWSKIYNEATEVTRIDGKKKKDSYTRISY